MPTHYALRLLPRIIVLHHRLRYALCLVIVLCGTAQGREPLAVEYTGALFGYYRMEARESAEHPALSAVQDFLQTGDQHKLLLGMGDNFGPEFGASLDLGEADGCRHEPVSMSQDAYHRNLPPVVFYKTDSRTPNKASCDNVAHFLMAAGYRAIVPGKEDFLYSAEWLQTMAQRLREASAERDPENVNDDHELHILAANLRFQEEKSCPLLFSDVEPNASGKEARALGARHTKSKAGEPIRTWKTECVDSEGEKVPVAQDWVERLDLTLDPANGIEDRIRRRAAESPYVRRQLLINQVNLARNAVPVTLAHDDAVAQLKILEDPREYEVGNNWVHAKGKPVDLIGKAEAKLCGGSSPESCQVIKELKQLFATLQSNREHQSVTDFAFRTDTRKLLRNSYLRLLAEEQENRGYTLARAAGYNVLLIGAIGPETMAAVSPTELGAVKVLDPQRAVEVVLRAAFRRVEDEGLNIDKVIVMAQMPRTEAEELGAHVRLDLERLAQAARCNPYRIDLMVSEAQADHATPEIALSFDPRDSFPVLTPHPAFSRHVGGLIDPRSCATLLRHQLTNVPAIRVVAPGTVTALGLMRHELNPSIQPGDVSTSQQAGIQYFLQQLQKSSHADVVLLERRDLYFDHLPVEYTRYEICERLKDQPDAKGELSPRRWCQLHIALDRVLWKGDLSERVILSGKGLKTMLDIAKNQVQQQQNLGARDTSDLWLVTFGITTNDQWNLTRLEGSTRDLNPAPLTNVLPVGVENAGTGLFGIPWSEACQGDTKQDIHYCVNGASIQDDAGYWVAMSDHIANDKVVYSSALKGIPQDNHQLKRAYLKESGPATMEEPLYITDELTRTLAKNKLSDGTIPDLPDDHQIKRNEQLQQERTLVHLDYGKLVAGFSARRPTGGNTAAAQLQGVTETRAFQPTQQELDLESAGRTSIDILTAKPAYSFSMGFQVDAQYDRSAQGNLSNKPINASYPANSLSVGGFLQKRLPMWGTAKTTNGNWANREVPRLLVVLTPHQYQQQLNGTYLFFPFMSPTATGSSGQFTPQLRRVTGFVDRLGLRLETAGKTTWWKLDRGSYAEAGEEIVVQNNVLNTISLQTGNAVSQLCSAVSTKSIGQCFAAQKQFTIDNTTTVHTLTYSTLHTFGTYWDVHLQKGLLNRAGDKVSVNFSIDSKGDLFHERQPGASLSTQTRYAFPITTMINFPVFRNLLFSPTYSAFFYENQIAHQSIVVNTYSIVLKWYYDRDSGVPLGRMLLFSGPASQDQTKTAKMK